MTLIRFDECINPRIVGALRAIGLPDGVVLETPQELGQRGEPDVNWIEAFAARGGRLFVSGDGNLRRVQLERAALEAAGLIAVFPGSMKWYGNLRRWGQAAFITAWFPAIVRLAEEGEAGTHYRLPQSFSGEFDSVEVLKSLAQIELERDAKIAARLAGREDN
ncbi:hypothetical protein [Caulobacter sp. NIBR1757]|uniref:PIN-like domain-containing protein n=1 Tax=Caulobacter sp. NIBR1757 TaxID=3016000 RepID=UPI0022F03CDA|nr:hypothetical protein [Caulobacter sp. NIBR1757]